jgi:uncharacterized protein (DUF2126 family)
MNIPKSLGTVADQVDALFAAQGARMTLGGEPTYVPIDPVGAEWHVTALGPTKLRYGYALAEALVAQCLPNAVTIYSTGKYYPGEVNPRWAINLLWNRDGSPLVPSMAKTQGDGAAPTAKSAELFCKNLLRRLRLGLGWMRGADPFDDDRFVRVLPLDHDGTHFITQDWQLGDAVELLRTEGPAGLRLPLSSLPASANRRALAVEIREGQLHLFLPPLPQAPFLELLEHVTEALHHAGLKPATLAGYIPPDEAGLWTKMAIAADPGVLEINLPPCNTWREYAIWMDRLEHACAPAGLRSFKQITPEDQIGTGGGNHVVFGGPSLDANPFFTRPAWVTSILRYWQHHPALGYLFTGQYVGSSSQAPRPDEGATAPYDLEMAYLFLEQLPPGDHRYLISETLRHLHTDTSGNTHRSETSFDKFWNVNFDGGSRGLIEFRALESLPHARWMSAIALLWHTLAAWLLAHPFHKSLVDHGDKLHDFYFLPTCLWDDFEKVLRDLKKAGFKLPAAIYREVFEWRFPVMLEHGDGDASLTIRRAHEGWPLLCETPLEGGSTSRFVDTSIERLELIGNRQFAEQSRVHVHGRPLPLQRFPGNRFGVGLRYRRTALYPSLHPGIPPQMPLLLTVTRDGRDTLYRLDQDRRQFERCPKGTPLPAAGAPCQRLNRGLVTCDLRLQ